MDELDRTLQRQLRRLGLSPHEPPADPQVWRELLARVGKTYEESRRDVYLLQRSISLVSVEMQDLNEELRVSAASQVDAQRDRLEAVLTALSDGFCRLNLNGEIRTINPAGEQLLNGSEIGDRLFTRLHFNAVTEEATREQGFSSVLERLRAGYEIRDEAAELKGERHPPVPLAVLAFPIAEAGYISSIGVMFRDVTDVVTAERARRTETLASWIRAEVAAALHGPGMLRERVQLSLQVLAQGIQQDEVPVTVVLQADSATAGEPVRQLIHGPGQISDLARIEGAIGQQLRTIDKIRRFGEDVNDAECEELRGIIVPLSPDSGVSGHLVMFVSQPFERVEILRDSLVAGADMLSLSIAEDRARRALESARINAEETAEAKSQFLANMSHEIRTPLNGVLGMLEMLEFTGLNPKQDEYVTLAQSSAETLLTVINDILDFSKIEAGKLTLEEIPFDVREITEDVTALHSPQAAAKHLELSCFIPPGLPTAVRGDPTRLRQVLSNLVSNAIKFTSQGEVAVAVAAREQSSSSISLEFTVTDTGIGIDDATQARLFDSFAQGDASTTRRFGGTGLGLAISRELLTLMGGSIKVASVAGSGTTFSVNLTLELQPVQSGTLANLGDVPGMRVLVVDDNQTNRAVLSSYLSGLGVPNQTADNGFTAMQMLSEATASNTAFTVAMVDMQMPGFDGVELARQIRGMPGLSKTKLVLVSSISLDTSLMPGELFDFCIAKPLRQAVVRDILRELVGGVAAGGARGADRPNPTPDGGKLRGRVLLVEDNAVNLMVAKGMLVRLGLEVTTSADGQQALDRLATEDFDLVLMDCQMPVLDGFTATRELRRRESSVHHTPVIALTADAMAGTEAQCLDAGMDAYLTKPYTLVSLQEVINSWLPTESHPEDGQATQLAP